MQVETTKVIGCPDFEDLSCFIDEELEPERLDSVRDHVGACERCTGLTSRLRQGFGASPGGLDGGTGGARCADEEGLILYLTRGLANGEREAVEAHLSRCDSCVYSVSLLRKRLHVDSSVDRAVPVALRNKVRELIDAGTRDLAAEVRTPAVSWVHRVREGLDRFLRLPVLVPAAVAAGALLVIGVRSPDLIANGSGMRAVEQVTTMRVTAGRATVRDLPRAGSSVVAELKAGESVRVASEDRDWYRVILSDERSGWVEREAFE